MNSLTFKICCNYNSEPLKRFIDSLLECHIDFNIRTYWKKDVKRMVDYYLVTIYDARKFIGSGKSDTEVYYDPDIFTFTDLQKFEPRSNYDIVQCCCSKEEDSDESNS